MLLHAQTSQVSGALEYQPARAPASWRSTIAIVVALSVIAFGLRAGAIVALKRWQQPNAIEHRTLAISLLQNGAFYFNDFGYYGPSSVQSPPYPTLLAALFKVFGVDSAAAYVVAMLINAAAGALTVFFTWRAVQTLGGTPRAALIAAALVAVWPAQIYAATHVQAISLITLCVVAMVDLFGRAVRSGRPAPWIAYSVVATFAALTEPVLLPPVAFSGLLILFWRGLTIAQRARNAAILLAAAMLIIMPWTVRNHTVHGQWMPIKSTFWVNVWKGNNDFATGTDRLELSEPKRTALKHGELSLSDRQMVDPSFDNQRQYDRLLPEQRARLQKQPEVVREHIFKEFATTWVAAHPGRYAQLCLTRLIKTFWVDWDNPKSHNVLFWLPRAALLLGLVPGIIIAVRQRWSLLFAAVLAGSCVLMYTLTITAARFTLPLEPLALCCVAAFLAADWRHAQTSWLTDRS